MSDQDHELLSGGRNRNICRNPTIHKGYGLNSTEIESLLAIERTKPLVLVYFLYSSEAHSVSSTAKDHGPRIRERVWRSNSACNPKI